MNSISHLRRTMRTIVMAVCVTATTVTLTLPGSAQAQAAVSALEWTGQAEQMAGGGEDSGIVNRFTLGWAFQVTKAIEVTALGCYDGPPTILPYPGLPGGDGLTSLHEIAIWDATDPANPVMLVSTTIAPGGGMLQGHFRFLPVANTPLSAGRTYVVAAGNYGTNEVYASLYPGTGMLGDGITYIEDRAQFTLSSPYITYPGNLSYPPAVEYAWFGGNFQYVVASTVSIRDVLGFLESSIANGTISGSGPGNSASARLWALRNMLAAAADFIASGDTSDAIAQLKDAYARVDGNPRPPDFVTGAAAPVLAGLIQQLIVSLGG